MFFAANLNGFIREILFQLVSVYCLHSNLSAVVFENRQVNFLFMNFRIKKEYLAQSEKGSWFDQPSKIGEEQVDKATGASSAHGASRKKVKGNLPKKSNGYRGSHFQVQAKNILHHWI